MAIKAGPVDQEDGARARMIEPFEDRQVRAGVVSYGLSSYGYDIRVADEFKVFTNINNTVIDPKNFDPRSFVDIKTDVCIVPPNSFALARTIEYFRIPRDVLTVCLGKSTYARCGIIVNVTPFEPEWEGTVTLEISNTTPLPARDLRQRGHRAGAVLPERRAVRGVLRRQEGQVPQADGSHAAEDLTRDDLGSTSLTSVIGHDFFNPAADPGGRGLGLHRAGTPAALRLHGDTGGRARSTLLPRTPSRCSPTVKRSGTSRRRSPPGTTNH